MNLDFKTLFKASTIFSVIGMVIGNIAENQQKKQEEEEKLKLEQRILELEEKNKE